MENQDPNSKEGVLVVATKPQELKSTLTFQGQAYTIQRYHFNEYNATWTGYYRCSKYRGQTCAAKLTVKIDELGEITQNSSDNHIFFLQLQILILQNVNKC